MFTCNAHRFEDGYKLSNDLCEFDTTNKKLYPERSG